MEGYGNEEYDEEGDEGMHGMEGYGQMEEDEGEGDSLNFDDNPEFAHLPRLDPHRKFRRDILRTINDVRDKAKLSNVHLDFFSNKAANEYAEYLLKNPENPEVFKKICNDFHVLDITGKGEIIKPIVGFAILEEEED